MLTPKRLNNLIIYWMLFRSNEDTISNSNNTLGCHHTYIKEKYDRFFNSKPTMSFMDMHDYHWKNADMWNKTTEFIVKWKLDTNEFINDDLFPEFFFTLNYIHNEETHNSTVDQLIDRLLKNYKIFFDSYDYISEEDLLPSLHHNLREYHTDIIERAKFRFRNLMLNNLIND